MSKFGILVDVDKCIACQACFVACKEENQLPPGMKWVEIDRQENPKARVINYFRRSCQHCEKPACITVCPAKAISQGKFGEVLVDQTKCIGCKMCLAACPYGAPQFNDKGETSYWPGKTPLAERPLEPWQKHVAGKAEHCTLCTHRTSKGMKPACVEACGIGALVFVDWEKPEGEAKELAAKAKALNAKAGTEPKIRYVSSVLNVEGMTTKL